MIHRRTHPQPIDGCFGCKLTTVQIGASVTTQDAASFRVAKSIEDEEKADRDAYRRLRKEGWQPPRIKGSARLERDASTPFEVATGIIYDKEHKRMLTEALSVCQDANLDVLTPATGETWTGD